jgi:BlaI family penicillinase repressor
VTKPAKAALADLTDLHLALLAALWRVEGGTIAEVHAAMGRRGADVTVKTVATLLARLEARGLVASRKDGREGVFRARVTRRQVLLARAQAMLASLFDDADLAETGVAAARKRDVRDGDADRLRRLLRRAEQDLEG